jgi:rubrerythrin
MLVFPQPMPGEPTHDVLKVIAACRGLELAMAGLYEELASLHSHVPSMARLWRKTAREELNHAAQFTLALDAMSDEIYATVGDASSLAGVRQAIETTLEEFRLRRPSVREALVAAIDFEVLMNELHADQILVFHDPRCCRLFEAMMAADNGHVDTLRAALNNLDGSVGSRPTP